jgi:ATP-dependent Clp protease ATP-binding subunit ClpC
MESAAALDAIVYFDDLSDLFGDQSRGGGASVDLAEAMRPFLEEGRVRLAGEITPDALDLFESRNVGFFSALHRIQLEPTSAEIAKDVLRARIAFAARVEPEKPNLAASAIDGLIDLAERYLPYQPFPGKVVRFFEQLRALSERDRDPSGAPTEISRDRVYEAFAVETGIPVFLLREDRALEKDAVIGFFQKRLIGQEDAVQRVVDTICVVKAGLQPTGKPLATFLFVGPTGVGKTELARTLASFLFGSPERMVRFDMSEYMDPFAAERLIRGTDRSEGLLTRKVRQQPFSVLLLDEIEKADPAVFDLLLQVAGEGRLTDARGKTAYFHNTIIIMTSNLGTSERKTRIGIEAGKLGEEEHYIGAVNRAFRPEFTNRIDRIVAFRELSKSEISKVADVAIARLKLRRGFLELGVELDLSDGALAALAEGGYSEQYGARALRRHLDDHLIGPVARVLGRAAQTAQGGSIRVRHRRELEEGTAAIEDGELRFQLIAKAHAVSRREVRGVEGVLWIRRKVDRWLELAPVQAVREQIAFLISQLAHGPGTSEDRRSSKEIGELQVEHHRLNELYSRAERLKSEIEAVEELALTALYSSAEDTLDLSPEAEKAFAEFRENLVYLLVAQETHRDETTLMLQELGEGRALDRWLVPFLRDAERRGWAVSVHLTGDADEGWPRDRSFGPPRIPRAAIDLVLRSDRPSWSALLTVRGPCAGILLSLEAGLHRWTRAHPTIDPIELLIHRVAPRAQLKDEDWIKEALVPPPPPPEHERKAWAAVRAMDVASHRLEIAGKRAELEVDPLRYWPRFEEIALEHLLLYVQRPELDRSELTINRLDPVVSS